MVTFSTPTTSKTVHPVALYSSGIYGFAQQSIADTIIAAGVELDLTNHVMGVALTATLEISYDGGNTWMTYTAGLNATDQPQGSPLGIYIGRGSSGLPEVPGRLVRGHFTLAGPAIYTSMRLALW